MKPVNPDCQLKSWMSFFAQVQPSSSIQRIQQGCWIENSAGDCKSQYNSEKVGSMLLCLWIGETEKKKYVICVLDSVTELCPDPGKDEMHSGSMLGEINLDLFTVSREANEGWLLAVFSSVFFTSVPPVPSHYLITGYVPEVLWLLASQVHTKWVDHTTALVGPTGCCIPQLMKMLILIALWFNSDNFSVLTLFVLFV